MDTSTIIELIGYVGSALVLLSMLMTSVVRLRVINLIGSIIFAVYALMIRSYPTAVMNIALAGINIYQLTKLFNEKKSYRLIKTSRDDGFFSYMLSECDEDIRHFFPDYDPDRVKADIVYIVCCGSDPACLFLGKVEQPDTINTLLDYALPAYRDTSVGRFLHKELAGEGYKTLIFGMDPVHHTDFLEKTGYRKDGDRMYVLDLSGINGKDRT